MISQTAEYCLRAVVCLADGHCQTTHQIAAATKIPPGYLCKILQALNRAGLLSAQRGLNGGFVLQRDPALLTLLEVVRVADPSHRIFTCPLGIHGTNLCALHRQLDDAAAQVELALANTTIAQLIAAPGIRPLRADLAREDGALANPVSSLSGDSPCLQ